MEYFWEGDRPPPAQAQPDTIHYLPLGACVSAGMYENVFGDANALVKRSAFEKLGGFREIHSVGFEDWELWARAVLQGFSLEVIPLPLNWYRVHPTSMSRTIDQKSSAIFATHPYRTSVSRDLRPALAFSVERWIEQEGAYGQGSSEVRLALQKEINALWDSLSWRTLRPLRNLAHWIKGLPKETRPVTRTDPEALEAIIALRQSLSWELTAPLRFAHRLLRGRRRTAK